MADHYFISDTHFGHDAIIRYCGRPFKNAEEMDQTLVDRWNKIVRPQDHIYHLGDVTMKRSSADKEEFIRLIQRLNGHKRLLLGNHDQFPVRYYLEAGFEKIKAYHKFEDLYFSHIPIHPESAGKSAGLVHGHIHQNKAYPSAYSELMGQKVPYVNISVEAIDYTPVNIEWLRQQVRRLQR